MIAYLRREVPAAAARAGGRGRVASEFADALRAGGRRATTTRSSCRGASPGSTRCTTPSPIGRARGRAAGRFAGTNVAAVDRALAAGGRGGGRRGFAASGGRISLASIAWGGSGSRGWNRSRRRRSRPCPGQIRVDLRGDRGQVGWAAETFDPGWKAEVDGRPVPTHPHLGAFLAARVPPGSRHWSSATSRARRADRRHGSRCVALGLLGILAVVERSPGKSPIATWKRVSRRVRIESNIIARPGLALDRLSLH